jgi:hypothetical protein
VKGRRKRQKKRTGYTRPHPGRGGLEITPKQRERAEFLAYSGWSQREIATDLGMALGSAREHLLEEMHEGKRRMLARVRGKCLEMALDGNEAQIRFILSHQDPDFRNRLALENPDGSPLSLPVSIYMPDNGRSKE